MSAPTPAEMAILNAAAEIEFKLQWLAEHPGKNRRDYKRGLKDFENGEVWKWRRAKGEARDKAERKAWLRDHPGRPLPEHLCSLTQAEGEELDRWRNSAGRNVGTVTTTKPHKGK